MPTFHRSSSHVDYNPGLEPQSDPSQPPDESIGNYLKSEHSLLIREQRSHRYSQNFRDSAVTRVLSGTIPLKQICRELDIHEADIIHWIDDFVMRKQVRIDQLTHLLESIQQELPPHLQMTMDEMEEEFESKIKNVVEGRVMPT